MSVSVWKMPGPLAEGADLSVQQEASQALRGLAFGGTLFFEGGDEG